MIQLVNVSEMLPTSVGLGLVASLLAFWLIMKLSLRRMATEILLDLQNRSYPELYEFCLRVGFVKKVEDSLSLYFDLSRQKYGVYAMGVTVGSILHNNQSKEGADYRKKFNDNLDQRYNVNSVAWSISDWPAKTQEEFLKGVEIRHDHIGIWLRQELASIKVQKADSLTQKTLDEQKGILIFCYGPWRRKNVQSTKEC